MENLMDALTADAVAVSDLLEGRAMLSFLPHRVSPAFGYAMLVFPITAMFHE